MKYVRKPEARPAPLPPAPEPKAPAFDTTSLAAVCEALSRAAERIRQPAKVEVTVPAAPKPNAFTVTITKRDAKGRVVEFDVRVTEDERQEEPDAFTSGFNNTKQ